MGGRGAALPGREVLGRLHLFAPPSTGTKLYVAGQVSAQGGRVLRDYKKYSDHLVKGRIEEAALLLASVENWVPALEVLPALEPGCPSATTDNSAEPVLGEAIWLEAARFLRGQPPGWSQLLL